MCLGTFSAHKISCVYLLLFYLSHTEIRRINTNKAHQTKKKYTQNKHWSNKKRRQKMRQVKHKMKTNAPNKEKESNIVCYLILSWWHIETASTPSAQSKHMHEIPHIEKQLYFRFQSKWIVGQNPFKNHHLLYIPCIFKHQRNVNWTMVCGIF